MRRTICLTLFLAASLLRSQPHAPTFNPLPPIAFDSSGPVIQAHTEALKPFTVAGERGVLVGQQDGTFEAWLLPMKLLSHLTIEAEVEGYTVPIDVNQQSAEIEVRPDRTVITYAHIGFTVRQIMFSPAHAPAGMGQLGTGPVVLFQFDCVHPTDFTLRFTPELRWMWPERNEGVPGVEWIAHGNNPHEVAGGFYVLHSDYPDFAAAVTIPGALPGILAPYQERPQVHPVELKLHIDPARDHGKLYPLLMAFGATVASSNSGSLGATLEKLNAAIPDLYKAHAEGWKKTLANTVSIETPDKALNEAFQWAVISIEQLKTRTIAGKSAIALPDGARSNDDQGLVSEHDFSRDKSGPDNERASAPVEGAQDETALVAGYYASGDSARPGFGWFFGRDALYTLYAVNGYGDFALSKSELEFLIRRQRDDGKIMHEWSQTAASIDWRSFPYMYAAADATPLFLLAVLDYVRASGDVAFLVLHRDAIEKAWKFETDPAHDTDHDGIYDNSQGTGWVESWPGGMPHQEIYLALLDQQASEAYAGIASLLGNQPDSEAASKRARDIAAKIESEYYDPQKGCYAFATNPAGSPNSPVDRTTTVYPALAWWSNSASGKSPLAHGEECLKQLAEHTLNTDWGLRDVSNEEKIYDGMSYHQGSVWPLFTGWAALAEYRGNQPLAGYQMLMENANLTWAQDLGADTELLSGDFNVPFGRSTTHQLWSSAMVITPTLRGLFGIDIDAQAKTINVNPHLPATWDTAFVKGISVGRSKVDLMLHQSDAAVSIAFRDPDKSGFRLVSTEVGAKDRGNGEITIPRQPVSVAPWFQQLLPGDRTHFVRITREENSEKKIVLNIEAPAGTDALIPLVIVPPTLKTHVEGANLTGRTSLKENEAIPATEILSVHFPPGEGWKTITVTLTW
jgi:glycogen debranching enzyme